MSSSASAAYEAYAAHIYGEGAPAYGDLAMEDRNAWVAAADAAIREHDTLMGTLVSQSGHLVPTVTQGETRWIHVNIPPVVPTVAVPETALEPATAEEHAEAAEAVDVEVSPDPER